MQKIRNMIFYSDMKVSIVKKGLFKIKTRNKRENIQIYVYISNYR